MKMNLLKKAKYWMMMISLNGNVAFAKSSCCPAIHLNYILSKSTIANQPNAGAS